MSEQAEAPAQGDERSPWLSLWLYPQRTIRQIIRHPSIAPIFLLAAAAGVFEAVYQLGERAKVNDPDLTRLLLLYGAAGASLGIVFIYANAAIMAGFGRLLGGRATMAQLRAAQAWSQVPLLPVLLVMAAAMAVFGADALRQMVITADPTNPYLLAFAILAGAASAWTLFLLVRMVGAVQNFGLFRSIVNAGGLFILLLLLLAIRSLALQPFSIPTGSMMPTLLVGDTMLASKSAFGYSRYSFPLPLDFEGRIWGAEPRRGDITIFRMPSQPETDFVKRIVGLPGDEISIRDGVLSINGQGVQRGQIDLPEDTGEKAATAKAYLETLPGGRSYRTLDTVDGSPGDNMPPVTVPAGHYFMLGDNRDNSLDSRFPEVSLIPYENLVARASVIFLSLDWTGGPRTRWSRIFHTPR